MLCPRKRGKAERPASRHPGPIRYPGEFLGKRKIWIALKLHFVPGSRLATGRDEIRNDGRRKWVRLVQNDVLPIETGLSAWELEGDIQMRCDQCREPISDGEKREHQGRVLCEDCYIDALTPAKACDPWAVYSAKSFANEAGAGTQLTDTQLKILQILKETGGVEPGIIVDRLQIKPADLDREIATLRHMEKIRGELRQGRKILRLW